jgi:hypothetical protein
MHTSCAIFSNAWETFQACALVALQKLAKQTIDTLRKRSGTSAFNGLHLRVEKDGKFLRDQIGDNDVVWKRYVHGMQTAGFNSSTPLYVASALFAGALESPQALLQDIVKYVGDLRCAQVCVAPPSPVHWNMGRNSMGCRVCSSVYTHLFLGQIEEIQWAEQAWVLHPATACICSRSQREHHACCTHGLLTFSLKYAQHEKLTSAWFVLVNPIQGPMGCLWPHSKMPFATNLQFRVL